MADFEERPLGSQYRVGQLIGQGGMGEVRRGTDQSGRPVAVKTLLPHLAEDAGLVARFVGEWQLLTNIRDRNVVRVRDLVAEGSTLAIVMDLVQGPDLRRYLAECGTLPAAEACRLGAQIASGLAAIHAARIVHRDVKPGNVLLDSSVQPLVAMLTDFGVSKLVAETRADPTMLAGTPAYLAPELIRGEQPGSRADLYSLGVVLYELLCGVTPFAGMAPAAVLHAQTTMDPGRPAGIDDRLWELLGKLLSKDPAHRPETARAVAARLEWLSRELEDTPALARLAVPPTPILTQQSWTMAVGDPATTPTRPAVPQQGPPPYREGPPPYREGPQPYRQGTQQPAPGGQGYPPPPPAAPAHYPAVLHPPTVVAPAGHATSSAGRKRSWVMPGIIVGLAVVIVAMVTFWVVSTRERPVATEPASADSTSPTSTQQSSGTATSEVSAVTGTAPAPATVQQGPEWPPAGSASCDSATAVNEVTSCSFAANVASAYNNAGHPRTVEAYSPVTGEWYDLRCAALTASIVECTGGTNAVVYLRR